MSYLYNMYAGSLEDLKARLDAVDLDDPEEVKRVVRDNDLEAYENLELDEEDLEDGTAEATVMSALIFGTWVTSPEEVLNWIDWHDEETFLELAGKRLSERGRALLAGLFAAPPLDVSPADWGFCGSLDHREVVELRVELGSLLPAAAVEASSSSSTAGAELVGGLPLELMLAWVYVSLRDVPEGLDVAVHLG